MGKTNFSYKRKKISATTACSECNLPIKPGEYGSAEYIDNTGGQVKSTTRVICSSCSTVWLTKITNKEETDAVKKPASK